MRVVQETITPARAEHLLKLNTHNRPINKNHLKFIVREMKEGRWIPNGDTITFNGDALIDGQHRLYAIIESGIPQPMLVVYDAPKDCFSTKDQGRKRQPGDVLAIHGVVNSRDVSAALRIVVRCDTHGLASAFANGGNSGPVEHKTGVISSTVIDYFEQHPRIVESVKIGKTIWMMRPAHASALHYLMGVVDREAADKFFDGILNGSGSVKINALRERLMKNKSTRGNSLSTVVVAALVIKTWNAVRTNKSIGLLSYKQGSESFPEIV